MPVKLNKVIKDLNVGLSTVVDFLNKKGYEVENNPNARVSDDQYDLLVKEFGNGIVPQKEKMIVKPAVSEMPSKEKPKTQEIEEIRMEIPEEIKPRIITKGKIDLEERPSKVKSSSKPEKVFSEKEFPSVNKKIKTPKVESEKPNMELPLDKPEVKKEEAIKAEPVGKTEPEEFVEKAAPEIPAEPVIEKNHKEPEPEVASEPNLKVEEQLPVVKDSASDTKREAVEEEPFRLNKPQIESNIKVTGRIDLSAINQATSPRKKTKEEKKREREERREKIVGQRKPQPQTQSQSQSSSPAEKTTGGTSADSNKQKRKRIRKDRVDVNNTPGTNFRREDRSKQQPSQQRPSQQRPKRPVRAEVNEEDVQKQVKETLARLTSKNSKGKAAKYRREKRDAAANRELELLEEERRDSKVLKLTEFVTANDLASMMNVPVTQVISTCMSIGIMVSINQRLDAETINIVAEEFGYTTEYVSADVAEAIAEEVDKEEDMVSRPPIVTVMGHVDHGKTSLLDNIRKSNVIAGEAGGITQHIGAYNVKLPDGRRITFLDTPGHEAFTAMRARGAQVTDIAIIIVAADDSVMPQTVEAINHASAAGVPIVFAINKIDKPHANPEKIKEELANMNYLVEDWGGKYQSQEISAKQGIGMPELLEKILLEAEMLDLKANPKRRATGSVIESTLDKGRGFVSTVLVSNGTLKQGDIVLAGTHYGRVKAMFNERNQRIEQAGPSAPATILGLDGAPQAGDTFNVLETEQEAREIATRREQLQRELGLRTQKRFGLEELGRRRALGNFHELNMIVKGDVDGSVEALSDSLIKLSTEEIQVNVIHKAVGQISESDISLAATADAIIIGFQVRPSMQARRFAESEGVEIRLYSIIYDAINDVTDAMEGLLSPEIREDICGEVEVLQVFKVSKVGTIAGCIVKEGKIKRTNKVRVIRDGIVIYTGDLTSLKRFKDEVKEAVTGQDCGIYINNYSDVQIGDIIEPFDQVEIKKTL